MARVPFGTRCKSTEYSDMNKEKQQKNTEISERVTEVLQNEGLTPNNFALKLGYSRSQTIYDIINGKSAPSYDFFNRFANSEFSETYDISWLLTGIGDMNKEKQQKSTKKTIVPTSNPNEGIPLIPIEVAAGFPLTDSNGIGIEDCERYIVPEFQNRGAQFLIRVSGNSMYPRYSSGDILACRKIEEIRFIQWGKVYVIDSSQDQLVKMIFEGDTPDTILCVSENSKEFPPFSLPKDDIRSLSTVIGCIKLE